MKGGVCSGGKRISKQKGLMSMMSNQDSNVKIAHGQPVLPQKDITVLKEKSGEFSITGAIDKAVYHYLTGNIAHKNKEVNMH